MFERFTIEARRAIFFARYEASLQSSSEITAGHILVGILREGESCSAAAMLLKDHEPDLRSALGIPSPSGKALSDLMKDIPLDQDAKMVLARAVNEAEMDNSFYVYTDHLLCGMLRFPNDASVALESIQLNLESTRAASRRHRTKYPTRRTFYHRLFGNPFRAHRTALLKLLIILIAMILGTLLVRWLNY